MMILSALKSAEVPKTKLQSVGSNGLSALVPTTGKGEADRFHTFLSNTNSACLQNIDPTHQSPPWFECLKRRSRQGFDHPYQARAGSLHTLTRCFPKTLENRPGFSSWAQRKTHLASLNNESLNDSDWCSPTLSAEQLQIEIKDVS